MVKGYCGPVMKRLRWTVGRLTWDCCQYIFNCLMNVLFYAVCIVTFRLWAVLFIVSVVSVQASLVACAWMYICCSVFCALLVVIGTSVGFKYTCGLRGFVCGAWINFDMRTCYARHLLCECSTRFYVATTSVVEVTAGCAYYVSIVIGLDYRFAVRVFCDLMLVICIYILVRFCYYRFELHVGYRLTLVTYAWSLLRLYAERLFSVKTLVLLLSWINFDMFLILQTLLQCLSVVYR
eukprot:gene3109-2091_t